jgi:centractin
LHERYVSKAAQVLFEEMRVPALFVAPQAILSLYSSGRTTGLVLDCGDGVSHAVPVYQGFALRHAITRVDVAGRDVTERLMLLARRAGVSLTSSAERELARTIKEEHCYVALDAAREEHSPSRPAAAYTLPDGTPLTLGAERFRAPEALFDSSLVGVEASGVQGCVLDAVRKSDLELRQHLLSQVVLAGGSTLYPGFGERLLAEVRKGSPAGVKVRIAAPPERKFMTWIGGSILASLATFKRMWVSKADYDEHGARILNDRSL